MISDDEIDILAEFDAAWAEIGRRTTDIDEDEVAADVAAALAEVRRSKHVDTDADDPGDSQS